MTERLIANTPSPMTADKLAVGFQALGVRSGDVVLAHSALSALGWVCGGAVTVIDALQNVVGQSGTLVMPTHSPDLTDPTNWGAPPVPADWIPTITATMPPFDPLRTPTSEMGAIPELFRTWPGVKRSEHPACSFAAAGSQANIILDHHALESPFGENSPLARLYDLDAKILLLGVGFDKCTALHLAEQRAWPDRQLQQEAAPIMLNGERHWVPYECAPAGDVDHFVPMGEQLVERGDAVQTNIGKATATLVLFRRVVDYAAAQWSRVPPH